MAYSQADLDRIDLALTNDVLELEVDGVRRRYRSVSELMKVRELIAGQLAATAPVASRAPATMYFRFGTGRDS